MYRKSVRRIFSAFIILGCIRAIVAPTPVFALGMSPAEFFFDTPLDADDTVSGTVNIGRSSGQTGALTIEVNPRGPCNDCVTGADYFVIPSDTQGYNYPFSISAQTLTEGTYTQYITFYLYSEAVAGGGTASMSIQEGLTIMIHFSVAAGTNTSSSGSSSSASSGGSGDFLSSTPSDATVISETTEDVAETTEEILVEEMPNEVIEDTADDIALVEEIQNEETVLQESVELESDSIARVYDVDAEEFLQDTQDPLAIPDAQGTAGVFSEEEYVFDAANYVTVTPQSCGCAKPGMWKLCGILLVVIFVTGIALIAYIVDSLKKK